MFNRIIHWSLRNRLVVVVGTVVFLCAGGWVLQHMSVDVFPEFAPPQVVVQTEAPGLAPEDVEALITFPVESAVNGTPGVESVRSASSVGLSTVVIVFEWGTDIYTARQLVGERTQSVRDRFPPGTNAPVMLPITSAVGWMVKYSLQSPTRPLMDLRTISDWEIRPRLLALGGVASVVSIGGDVKQYQVLLDPARLSAYGLTAEDIRTALTRSNVNAPGGFLTDHAQEYVVSAVGRITSLDDVRNTIVTVRDGTPVLLRNVATVQFGGEIKRGDGAFGLEPAVIGTVSKAYGADTLTTTYKVETALRSIQATLPKDITLNIEVFRQADFIESSIHNLSRALIEGAIIVTAILFLFLMNVRTAFITLVSIPASLLGGILTLHAFGIGINAMTLGGLAVAIGEVVDDAIIDVENVFRRLRLNRESPEPLPVIEVVFTASSEIRNSVVYATLIVVLVFLPIFFLTGLEGRIFAPLGIAYIASILASLVVTLTAVPALCSLLLGRERGGGHDRESAVVRGLKRVYARVLHVTLRHVWSVVGLAVALFLGAAAMVPFFGRSFLPEFHEGNFIVVMSTLPGTSLEESMRLGRLVRERLVRYPQVVSIAQRAGRSELDEDAQPPNFSEFDLKLDYARDPSMPPEELLRRIRADLGDVPGALFNVGQFISHRMDEILSGVRAQVAIKLYGPDLTVLRAKGQEILKVMKTVPGVADLQVEPQIDVPQLVIRIDRARAARYGVKVGDLAEDIETFLNGVAVSQVVEGQRTFDLFVRLEESARGNVDAIRNILVDAGEPGRKVPLRAVADLQLEPRPYFINRENVQRRIVVQCNVAGRDLQSLIAEAQSKIAAQVPLPPGYFLQYGGQFESQQAATRVLTALGSLAIVGIFLLLYQAFGNAREAVLVMFNLPLALIGGVVGVFLAGGDMSVASLIGFVTLFGIATRNGIILVSHYNQLTAEGLPLERVVVEGSMDRLTPVLMTATTAALGLLPLLWGDPTGKELQRPLAVVVLGGLFTSTFLNLAVVPTVYQQLERWRLRHTAPAIDHNP
ncbi:MAG: efflux RND transporter permease subunit [Candidatus Binatia bacterium]